MSQSPESLTKEPTDIFINYRRADTSGHAGRLEQNLSQRFPGRVFMDIHTIEVGTDFADAINNEVGKCGALIVMIGNQWLDITDPKTGKRRLDNPNDFVALEIAEALKRSTRVIPVLVEGAKMPEAEELPASLAALVRRNAIELSDTRWDYDVQQLIKVLEKICGLPTPSVTGTGSGMGTGGGIARGTGTGTGTGTGAGTTSKSRILKIAIPIAAALLAVVALGAYLSSRKNSDTRSQASLVSPSPVVPTPAQGSNQLKVSGEEEGTAVVDLEKVRAEFLFPFKTEGNWTWFLNPPKPWKDVDEYHWVVYAEGKPDSADYRVIIFIENGADDSPSEGKLKALISDAEKGVQIRKAGADDFGEVVDSIDKDAVTVTPTVQPNGLKVTVTGVGVKRIFGHQPKEVTLYTRTPKQENETTEVIDVKYLPN